MNNPCYKMCKPHDTTECEYCKKAVSYQQYLEKKRKYKKSDTVIDSVEKLKATEWFWWEYKPMHRAFIISMPFRTVLDLIETRRLYAAELKQKPLDQQQQT